MNTPSPTPVLSKIVNSFKSVLSDAAKISAIIMIVSAGSLAFALVMEHFAMLEPCILCIYQRWPYMATGFLGLVGLVLALKDAPKPAALMVFICGIVFLAGAAVAFYHVGVEQHWWRSAVEGCTVDFSTIGSGADLLAQIERTAAVPCDKVLWSMFGISMAGYNFVLSLGLAAMSFISAVLITRRANGF